MRRRLVSIVIVLIVATGSVAMTADEPDTGRPSRSSEQLAAQASAVADLSWLPAAGAAGAFGSGEALTRPALAERKHRALARGDAALVAQLNAILASEGFIRAAQVTERWLDARDQATGLLTNVNGSEGDRLSWAYQNTAADLYPFIAIGA